MVAGHLQEKNGYFYAVLSYKDAQGKRKTKWIPTGYLESCNQEADNMDNAEKAKFLLSLRIDEELDNSPLSEEDQVVLSSLLHEINVLLGTSISTFAELASLHLHGCGEIVAKYILLFSSESAKMELLHHLVYDRIANCGDLLLHLYKDYLQSKATTSDVLGREEFYDNAFWRLKSKRMANDLLELISDPSNAYALPLTLQMISSWRYPCLLERLLEFIDFDNSQEADDLRAYHNYHFICRELRISAISCLRYYPTSEVLTLLREYANDIDNDIRKCANSSLSYALKRFHQ